MTPREQEIVKDCLKFLSRDKDMAPVVNRLQMLLRVSRRHKWKRERFSWWTQGKREQPYHCVQCGAENWVSHTYLAGRPPPRKFYRPFGDIAREFKHMPKCEGLPPQYDAPIGA